MKCVHASIRLPVSIISLLFNEFIILGNVVMGDSFNSSLFKQTYQRVFEKDSSGNLKMGFNATMEVKVGTGLKIEGALGCCANPGVKNHSVSDTEMGLSGTCQWRFCGLSPRTTIAIIFEIAAQVCVPSEYMY
jgi:protein transport protein SEC23